MPTNDERRDVAARLRYAGSDCLDGGGLLPTLKRVLGVEGSWRDVFDRLADLIEPEERTCRNTAGKPFAGYRMFSCSECGAYLEVDGDTDANLFAGGERPMPRYCPNCGAKVVRDA